MCIKVPVLRNDLILTYWPLNKVILIAFGVNFIGQPTQGTDLQSQGVLLPISQRPDKDLVMKRISAVNHRDLLITRVRPTVSHQECSL